MNPGGTRLATSGGEGTTYATGGAVGPDGCAVVVGEFNGTTTFTREDGTEETVVADGSHDTFIAQYDPTGGLLWARACGGSDICAVAGVDVSPDGQVTAVGYFFDSITFDVADAGPTTLTTPIPGWEDGFIARLSSDGRVLWVEHISTDSLAEVLSVVARADGSVVVAGIYDAPLTLGTGASRVDLVPSGWWEGLLAAYAADGTLLWARSTNSLPGQGATMWALDAFADGSIAVAGDFEGTTNIGSQELTSVQGSQDSWMARYGPDGEFEWARRFGGTTDDYGSGVCGFADGSLLIAGSFQGEATLGDPLQPEATVCACGDRDAFVGRLLSGAAL